MTARTSFQDTSSGGIPVYDFVARPKNVMPGSSSTFAGVPVSVEPPAVLAAGYVPDKAPGLSRAQKGLVSAVLLTVLAALAWIGGSAGWRAYRTHQREAIVASTKIVLPPTVAGMAKRGPSAQGQVDRLIGQISAPSVSEGAAYAATKTKTALVVAGTFPMSDRDQRDFLAGVGEVAQASGVALARVEAGGLGGQMVCGNSPKATQTMCAFTDVAAYGVVVVPGSGATAVNVAQAFRTAVERRS